MALISIALLLTSASAALAQNVGRWSSIIRLPVVPVAAAPLPGTNGQILVWSAFNPTEFESGKGRTQTAIFNPGTGGVTQRTVTNTRHDMFCPGISFDFNGNLMVTGGNDASRSSIYSTQQRAWISAPDMRTPRGYQTSVTLSDGRIFQIGGSWVVPEFRGNKHGEIWDGQQWTSLPGARVDPILTADRGGNFRNDNHAMLFGWSNGSAISVGPSRAMVWYYTQGQGSFGAASTRTGDGDAMCGVAAMYDAVEGKIHVASGSPDYENAEATSNSFIVTIGAPGTTVSTERTTNMAFRRIFATSTILPDGQVFVVGGQSFGVPFSDNNAIMTPELWSSTTKTYTRMANHRVPRTYHSVSVLMADGRVFVGGGGLCGGCNTNHLDAEIFTPPYLLRSDGRTAATRPTISAVSLRTVRVGNTFTATIRSSGANGSWTFAIMRLGSSTHTVNSDQRRVPLVPTSVSNGVYTFRLPGDPGICTPGYWWLFAMENGVPSVATELLVSP